MYKVMLVDDERWILESLKGTVDWEALGFSIAGEAYNGVEAYEKMMAIRPDAAFIDIRMPGMNGLQLIKRLHDAGVPVQCVIASGYAEFEYAKQAMQYGAAGYCLKPFNKEEIEQILIAVKSKLSRHKQLLQLELVHAVFGVTGAASGSEPPPALLGEWEKGQRIIVVQGGGGEQWAAEQRCVPVPIGRGKLAYLVECGELDSRLVETLESGLSPAVKGVGISARITDPGRIRDAVDEANVASYGYFTTGQQISLIQEPACAEGWDAEALLEEGINRQHVKLLREGLVRAGDGFAQGRYDIRLAYRLSNRVLAFVYRTGARSKYEERYIHDYDELAARYETAAGMIASLLQAVTDSVKHDVPEADDDNAEPCGEEVLPQIVQYVKAHFGEHLSIQEIAKRFYMHPNYVSFLFKKTMQVNFTKYLTDIRMDHAGKLLRGTDLTVGEVAEHSGYGDYFYFAKIFKKHTGLTPTEYRQAASREVMGNLHR